MAKFCICAVLKSNVTSSGYILVFEADDDMKSSCYGNVVILNCKSLNLDEVNSSRNWRDAFGFNLEPPKGALIMVNPGYLAGRLVSYFEGKFLVLMIIGTIFN